MRAWAISLALLCGLLPAACAFSGPEELDLDNEHSVQAEVEVGEDLVLDFRSPESGGYDLMGAYFDPQLLKLTSFRIVDEDEDEGDRLEYVFTALKPGSAMIEIRIKASGIEAAMPEVYKRIILTIDPD